MGYVGKLARWLLCYPVYVLSRPKRAESEEYGIKSDKTDIHMFGVGNLAVGFISLPSSLRLRAI